MLMLKRFPMTFIELKRSLWIPSVMREAGDWHALCDPMRIHFTGHGGEQ